MSTETRAPSLEERQRIADGLAFNLNDAIVQGEQRVRVSLSLDEAQSIVRALLAPQEQPQEGDEDELDALVWLAIREAAAGPRARDEHHASRMADDAMISLRPILLAALHSKEAPSQEPDAVCDFSTDRESLEYALDLANDLYEEADARGSVPLKLSVLLDHLTGACMEPPYTDAHSAPAPPLLDRERVLEAAFELIANEPVDREGVEDVIAILEDRVSALRALTGEAAAPLDTPEGEARCPGKALNAEPCRLGFAHGGECSPSAPDRQAVADALSLPFVHSTPWESGIPLDMAGAMARAAELSAQEREIARRTVYNAARTLADEAAPRETLERDTLNGEVGG